MKKLTTPDCSWADHFAALVGSEADYTEIAATHCLRAVNAGSKAHVWGHLHDAIIALDQDFSVADLLAKYGTDRTSEGLRETARLFAAELGYSVG